MQPATPPPSAAQVHEGASGISLPETPARELSGLEHLVTTVTGRELPPMRGQRKRAPRHVLVLDLSTNEPRAIELHRSPKGATKAGASFTLASGPPECRIEDIEFLTALHDALVAHDVEARHVAVVLPDQLVHHRSLTLPQVGKRALQAVLLQKGRQLDEKENREPAVGCLTEKAPGKAKTLNALLAAAPRSELLAACRGLQEIGLEPVAFYPSIAALHEIYRLLATESPDGCVALAQIEEREARFALVHGCAVYYDRSIAMESGDLDSCRMTLIRQVHRTLLHHQQQRPDRPLSRVLLLDENRERAAWIAADFARELVVPVETVQPSSLVSELTEVPLPCSAVLAGTVRLLASRHADAMNLIPREVRTRRRSLAMGACSFLLAAVCIGASLEGRRSLTTSNERALVLLQQTEAAIDQLRPVRDRHEAMKSLRTDAEKRLAVLERTAHTDLRTGELLACLAGALSDEMALDTVSLRSVESAGRPSIELTVEGHCRMGALEAQQAVGQVVRRLKLSGLIEDLRSEPLRARSRTQPEGEVPFMLVGHLKARPARGQE
ncbi:MAG: hypothetical protein AB1486_17605 [Planctomycetota bacterium]